MLPISILLFYVILGCLSAYIADKKKRNVIGWFFAGAFFGFIGLVVLLLLPSRRNALEKPQNDPFDNSDLFDDLKKSLAGNDDEIPSSGDLQEIVIDTEKWFYLNKDRENVGPISFEELVVLLKGKTYPEEIWVWKKGMKDWQRVKDVPSLQQALKEASK